MSPACAERSQWLKDMCDDMADGLLNIIEKKLFLISQFTGDLADRAEEIKKTNVADKTNWIKIVDSRDKKI